MSDLKELLERVKNATGPDFDLDQEIEKAAFGDDCIPFTGPYTGSIDAIKALIEAKLPDWSISLGEMRGLPPTRRWRAWLSDHNAPEGISVRSVDSDNPTPALALCAAFLSALAATEAKP